MVFVCVLVCVFMHACVCVRASAFRSYCRIHFARKTVSIYWAHGKAFQYATSVSDSAR
jgi:hypothetical protein